MFHSSRIWPVWTHLHDDRWRWADVQIQRFVDSLDHDSLRSHFESSRSGDSFTYNAVLYGKTQVGKTTLILRLLGLEQRDHELVARVLRGDRGQGESATAVPTRYRWSNHRTYWQIGSGNRVHEFDDDAARAYLTNLRTPDGTPIPARGVIEIGIPNRFRNADALSGHQEIPMILDLPGAEAQDEREREYAARLIREYLPLAHVVVLVTRADQLTSLFSRLASDTPELAIWAQVPERFRVVLTHTVSAASIREAIRDHGSDLDADWLRNHVFDELLKSGAPKHLSQGDRMHSRVKDILYPVEYGRSWEQLQENDQDLYSTAKPVVDGLLEELAARVSSEAAEDARRISVAHATRTVQLAADKHLAQLQARVEQAEERNKQDAAGFAETERALSKSRQNLKLAHRIDDALGRAGSSLPSPEEPPLRLDTSTAAIVRRNGNAYADSLGERWQQLWEEWCESNPVELLKREVPVGPPESKPVDGAAVLRRNWSCGGDCCSSHWTRPLRRRNEPSHCLDKLKRAKVRTHQQMEESVKWAQQQWIQMVRQTVRRKNLDVPRCRAEITYFSQELARATRTRKQSRIQYRKARADVRAYERVAEDAVSKANRLDAMLNQGLRMELQRINSRLVAAGSDDDQLGAAMEMLLALRQRDKLEVDTQDHVR